jgi:FkbM family methyltransferase
MPEWLTKHIANSPAKVDLLVKIDTVNQGCVVTHSTCTGRNRLKNTLLRGVQNIIILTVRPYVIRELPGWGKLFALALDYRRDWLWAGAPSKTIRQKSLGHVLELDLSQWADRSTYFLGRWHNLEMQRFMSDVIKPGDTVVDIGANRGNFALAASHLLGNMGKVLCFEPNPNCIRILDNAVTSNHIENMFIYPVGLGDREEELTLSVPTVNSGEGTFGRPAYGNELTYQVRAQVKVGDKLLANERPSLIKIDVEGFECKVIAGLAETIGRNHPIVLTEVIPTLLERCDASVADLMALMQRFGYQGFKLGLKKEHGRYDWQLISFDPRDGALDAVWLHPDAMRRHAMALNEHTLVVDMPGQTALPG